MEIVIFDTEYTTWVGSQERRWLGVNEYKEIIQISAIKAKWPETQIMDELTVTVKPKRNKMLSEYCKKLTGISQQTIDTQGVSFQRALQIFLNFCGENLTLSYGNDAGILAENIVLNEADPLNFYGPKSVSFVNIKYWLLLADDTIANLNSGKLWQHFGALQNEKFKHEHNSLSDCYSILQTIKCLHKTGSLLPFQ